MNGVPLEQEQEELLAIMVEASRAIPRDQRQEFLFIQYAGGRSELAHPGMEATGRKQYQAHLGDLQTLHERGLIRLRVEQGVYLADLKPAISLYPVLKRASGTLALGAVVFRAIEAVMYTLGAVSMLSLAKVAQQFTQAVGADRSWVQAIGDSLVGVRQEAILAGVFAFAVGALMYYYAFFRSRLLPRWLSGWGIAGALLMLAACLAALFSRNPVTSYTILIPPIAVQEIVMAVWLIARGFSPAGIEAGTIARVRAA